MILLKMWLDLSIRGISNNKDNKLTNYFMEKTYKYLYGDLIE